MLSDVKNPDVKSSHRGRVWGGSQQLGWGLPGGTAGVLPSLRGPGLSMAPLTDHTCPRTLGSPDGPALDSGFLLWGPRGFGGRPSCVGRAWGPRTGRCGGGARLAPSGCASCLLTAAGRPLEESRGAPAARVVHWGPAGAGLEREGWSSTDSVSARGPAHLGAGELGHPDTARGGLPPLAGAFSPAPSLVHFLSPPGPRQGPWGCRVNSQNLSTQRCPEC